LAKRFAQRYVIDPILPAEGVGLLHGKGGHGKTQLAFTLMKEMIEGGRLFDRYAVTEGRVLYLQFDMPEELFHQRITRASEAFADTDLFYTVAYPRSVNILEKSTQERIAESIAEAEPSLVIFDTLRKLHPYDENDNAVPNQVYSAIREVCAGAGALVIHHDRKSPTQPGADEDVAETFRGARAWVDDSDLGMRLRKRGNKQIMLDWSKVRCEEQPPILLQMNPETLLLENRQPLTAKEWALSLIEQHPTLEHAELAKLVMERADCSKVRAYQVIKSLAGD
jgi:RecA-family ATPase